MPVFQKPVDQRWLNTVSCFFKIGINHLWPEIGGGNFSSEWCYSVEIQTRAQVVFVHPTLSYFVRNRRGKCPNTTQGLWNWRTDSAFDRQLCPMQLEKSPRTAFLLQAARCKVCLDISFRGKVPFPQQRHLGCYYNKKNINTHMPRASPHFFLLLQTPAMHSLCSGCP